jgi:DNA-binding CsgD family transcriptional regulator
MILVDPQIPIGRERQLGEIEVLLDSLRSGLSALTLTGAAGIGKTTLWREGLRRAASRGISVLSTRPSQQERSLSFAGLADLLEPVSPEAFELLAPAQRRAIDVALLRAESGASPSRGAIHAAVLSLVRRVAATRRVLIAVDDAQWLDDATAESLSFTLRRVEQLPVGVLASVRLEGGRPQSFETAVTTDRRRDLAVGPLSVAALHAIVKQRLTAPLPRPVLVRVVASSGGNPFYALEIARELERVGVPTAGQPLPVPGELQALVRSRMARLPRRTRYALLTAACMSQPTIGKVDIDALGPAEQAGIVVIEQTGRLRFGHPLLAAAVQESAPTSQRLEVHRQLAEHASTAGDLEERARHLAEAATGPDETVAAALDAAAERAASRGALTAAAALARKALELTLDPASDQAMKRVISFAEQCLLSGGDPGEVGAVLEAAIAMCPSNHMRAELRLRLAWVMRGTDAGHGDADLLKAIDETSDRGQLARIHMQAVWMAQSDAAHGLRHCDAALELLDEATDPFTFAALLMHRAYLRLLAGRGADDAAMEQGKAIEERLFASGLSDRDRSPVPVIWPLLKDEFTHAVSVHTEHLEWSRQIEMLPLEQSLSYFLAMLELWRGNWDRAEGWVTALADLLDQSGSDYYLSWALVSRGMLDAHRGLLDDAEAAGTEAVRVAAAAADRGREAEARQLLGFVALSRGDLAGAAEHLLAADRIVEQLGQREPAGYRFHPDLIEALIGLGALDQARAQVERLAERARVFPRPWILVMRGRCRGLLLAAEGDLDGADAALQEALAAHENLEMPFERGRTLLAYGQVLRRRNSRRAARAALEEALATFAGLGAPVWADRAAVELTRVPRRRAPAGLTPTEERIARLVADGWTNRQIAERAFVSTKTVEANLSRIYSKLGVRSRTQLVRTLAEAGSREPPPEPVAG